MKKFIIITSIFEPTEAVKAYAKLPDYQTIVIGDQKSPIDWFCENTSYFSVEAQGKMNFKLLDLLPFNHYCRKMLGYLIAMEKGAEYIIDTDDDNIPKSNYCFPVFEGIYDTIQKNLGFINIYQLFTEQKIWPRGLPLNFIKKNYNFEEPLSLNQSNVGIWQGLADEDPDVDAIYRLVDDSPCYFREREPVVLSAGTITPFNTQNTIVKKALFPLLYLPTTVTFRFTDILRGLVAQPIMWLYNYQLGFTTATVIQKRNDHDYMKDFLSEIPMYESSSKVIDIVSTAISADKDIFENLVLAYRALIKEEIVSNAEMDPLISWLQDIKDLKF